MTETKHWFRAFLDMMNEDWHYDGAYVVFRWVMFTIAMGIVLLAGSCSIGYFAFDLPSQRAIIACQAKGMNAARPDFSREVTCLPRYRGSDSLNATVEAR